MRGYNVRPATIVPVALEPNAAAGHFQRDSSLNSEVENAIALALADRDTDPHHHHSVADHRPCLTMRDACGRDVPIVGTKSAGLRSANHMIAEAEVCRQRNQR
jgi:hypothetical protein